MSINLMDMVKGAVSDQVMGQLGGLLGQSDSKKTASMFETATSSILGGLMKKASTPEGADEVFNAARDNDDSMLDSLGDIFGGGQDKQDEMMNSGGGMLDMIFGSNRGGVMGMIAKFLGLDDGIMGKLMSVAAPIVMSVIGKQVASGGLDVGGLTNLLSSQKDHLGSSMPSQLSGALGIGDMLGSAGDAVRGAGQAVGGAVGNAADAVGDAAGAVGGAARNVGGAAVDAAGDAASAGGGLIKFLLPIILLGALVWAAITYLPGLLSGAADKAGDAAAAVGDTVGDAASGVGDAVGDAASGVGDALGNAADAVTGAMPGFEMPSFDGVQFPEGFDVSGVTDQFKGITDGISNVSADNVGDLKSKIEGLTENVDSMGLGDLTGGAKTAMGGMIGSFVKTIQGALGGMEGGILDTLKPVVEALIAKLKPMMG